MRSEAATVLDALDEAIRIGREAKIPVEIWHVKAAGKQNWGRMKEIVAKIEQARRDGVDITADTYGYTAWYNSLSAFIPPWAHDGGDEKLIARLKDAPTRARVRAQMLKADDSAWDNEWQEIPGPEAVLIGAVQNPELKGIQGKRLSEIAADWKMDPIDALCEIVIRDHAYTGVAVFAMSEPDVALAVQQPWVAFNNDSQGTAPTGLLGQEHPHPRAYGTFPRVLRKYVREDKLITLEDAIRKMSALPAQKLRLADRGVLKAGMWADMVVFDPATITDKATFAEPNQLSVGMDYVLVNGVPVIAGGKATGARPGKVLRGAGTR
jgi:dihydroorotase/N-acyl-D-amino-acid deacylase